MEPMLYWAGVRKPLRNRTPYNLTAKTMARRKKESKKFSLRISTQEYKRALTKCKNHKSADKDGLSAELVKLGGEAMETTSSAGSDLTEARETPYSPFNASGMQA